MSFDGNLRRGPGNSEVLINFDFKVYTDTLREEVKEVNHHGKPRKVEADDDGDSGMAPVEDVVKVSPLDLRHRREDKEVEARRQYYQQIEKAQKNKDKLRRCKKFGRRDIPTFIITFVIIYWVFGLSNMS